MTDLVKVRVVLFVIHADGYVFRSQLFGLVKDQLSPQQVENVQQQIPRLLREHLAVVEAQRAQFLLEFKWPP